MYPQRLSETLGLALLTLYTVFNSICEIWFGPDTTNKYITNIFLGANCVDIPALVTIAISAAENATLAANASSQASAATTVATNVAVAITQTTVAVTILTKAAADAANSATVATTRMYYI